MRQGPWCGLKHPLATTTVSQALRVNAWPISSFHLSTALEASCSTRWQEGVEEGARSFPLQGACSLEPRQWHQVHCFILTFCACCKCIVAWLWAHNSNTTLTISAAMHGATQQVSGGMVWHVQVLVLSGTFTQYMWLRLYVYVCGVCVCAMFVCLYVSMCLLMY